MNAGKKELEALRESEKETSVLKPQLEDLRLQKKAMERLIGDQRNAWEKENTRRDWEERERRRISKACERGKRRSYREDEENERDASPSKARRRAGCDKQGKSSEIRAAEEKDFLARRSVLDKKERELALLIQALEKFLSGLAGRKWTVGAQTGASDS